MKGTPPGERYMAVAGVLAFGCSLLDLNWSSPSFPKQGDPHEAFKESSALFRLSRYLTCVLGVGYVLLCAISILAIQFNFNSKQAVDLTLLIAVVLLAVALYSNQIAGDSYYDSPTWHGPNWYYTTVALGISVLACFLSWYHIEAGIQKEKRTHKKPSRASLEPLLAAGAEAADEPGREGEKENKEAVSRARRSGGGGLWHCLEKLPCFNPCFSCCTALFLLSGGVLLFCLGAFFYVTQPKVSTFGSIRDHQSFLEWHHNGGSIVLNNLVKVSWAPELGIRVHCDLAKTEVDDTNPCWQSPGSGNAFIVASLAEDGSPAKAHTTAQSGVFKIFDEPGTLSTEQVVESISTDSSSITFTGFLYYGPFVLGGSLGQVRDPTWRTSFSFTISAGKADAGAVMVNLNATAEHGTNDRVYLISHAAPTERIFGMGESYTWMDLRGGVVPVATREQGIGRGVQPLSTILDTLPGVPSGTASQTTYSAIPHFTTTAMRSFYAKGTEFMVMDFSRRDDLVIEVNSTKLEVIVFHGSSPKELVQSYTEKVSGVMRPLPDWVSQGAVLGLQGGTKVVADKLKRFLDAGVPVTAIWLQDWSGALKTGFGDRLFWNWESNEKYYPEWTSWLQDLFDAHGISVLSYINPYLSTRGPMFKEANEQGCLLPGKSKGSPLVQESGTPDFRFGTVNLFKRECADWYVGVIRSNMIGQSGSSANSRAGVMGWMADFGESVPFEGYGSDAHNAFPGLWAETNRRAIDGDDYSRDNVVFFTRSSNALTPGFSTLQWMGDQLTDWDSRDGLHSALIAQMSAGLSGIAYSHSDVGGYTMVKKFGLEYVRDAELLMRWAESSAFADSMFRTHEGLLPDASAQAWDEQVLPHFARFATVFKQMAPVRKAVQQNEPGMPVMRSMWMHFHTDEHTVGLKTQFLVGGPDILVCPVLRAKQNTTACYIPKGLSLEHVFFPQETYETEKSGAKTVHCSAPLGKPCVLFNKANAQLMALAQEIRQSLKPLKPTAAPTKAPTHRPTHSPTHKPTKKPTTAKPTTQKPTPEPTQAPTASAAGTAMISSLSMATLTMILMLALV